MTHYDSIEARHIRTSAYDLFKKILIQDGAMGEDLHEHNLYRVRLSNQMEAVVTENTYLGVICKDKSDGKEIYTGFDNKGSSLALFGVKQLTGMTHGPSIPSDRFMGTGDDQCIIDYLECNVYPAVKNLLDGKEPLVVTRLASGITLEKDFQKTRVGNIFTSEILKPTRGRGERFDLKPMGKR